MYVVEKMYIDFKWSNYKFLVTVGPTNELDNNGPARLECRFKTTLNHF